MPCPRDRGPAFIVIGVFDGLHLGHRYLLAHLVAEAAARDSEPTVITFDHHPDEILTGSAPPLLLDMDERTERMAEAGVAMTVIQAFDETLRRTPYDVFVERIRERVPVSGFLMTPDAAFGFERGGTPQTLAELGRRDGFDVVVVPPFDLDGRPVRSSEIRAAIADGRLGDATALLGRPLRYVATCAGSSVGQGSALAFPLPVALPPAGEYVVEAHIADGPARPTRLIVGSDGTAALATDAPAGARVALTLPSASLAT